MYKYLLIDLEGGIVHKSETYDKDILILASQDHLLINMHELTVYEGDGSEDLNGDWAEILDLPPF